MAAIPGSKTLARCVFLYIHENNMGRKTRFIFIEFQLYTSIHVFMGTIFSYLKTIWQAKYYTLDL